MLTACLLLTAGLIGVLAVAAHAHEAPGAPPDSDPPK